MSEADASRPEAAAREAAERARALAPDLASVLITHYPDAETLDTFQAGAGGLELAKASARAAALAFAEEGIEVLVQLADRGAFRRWMDTREDTPENRWAWRNRSGLLRGPEAFAALGLAPAPARKAKPPAAGKSVLSPADRLVRAFAGEDDRAFRDMAERLVAEGRDGVLSLALRKASERYGEEAAEDLEVELLQVAEGAGAGPSGWAELVALPVALPPAGLPDAARLGESLAASGLFPESVELRFLPEWRSDEDFEALEPVPLRRALLRLLAGEAPGILAPADPSRLAGRGFAVLLGLRIDWGTPLWEEIAAKGLPPVPEGEEETPEEEAYRTGFDRWRMAISDALEGCVPLALVAPSEVVEEIDAFLGESGVETGGIEEIREFVETARREVPEEEVVCRPEVVGEGLELTLYTRQGRFLDSLRLSREQIPAPPEEMPRLLEAFVPLVRDAPGR